MDLLQHEENKESWVPVEFAQDWNTLKKNMHCKLYIQGDHEKTSARSNIMYRCNFNPLCRSKYSMKKYAYLFFKK